MMARSWSRAMGPTLARSSPVRCTGRSRTEPALAKVAALAIPFTIPLQFLWLAPS